MEETMADAITLSKDDIMVLLNLMEATTFQSKAGAVQYLRIYHALEASLNADE